MTIQKVTCRDKGDYGLDEIVADNVSIHLERMSCGHIWMQIRDGDRHVSVNLHQSGRKIIANVEKEGFPAERETK